MSYETSVSDKSRDEPLTTTRLVIAGKSSYPVTEGNHDFEADVYGRNPKRLSATIRVRFVRLPSGDTFAWTDIPVDPARPDWAGVLRAMRVVNTEHWGPAPWSVGVEVDVVVSGLVLRNRVLLVARQP